jgi:hypothetical protein
METPLDISIRVSKQEVVEEIHKIWPDVGAFLLYRTNLYSGISFCNKSFWGGK